MKHKCITGTLSKRGVAGTRSRVAYCTLPISHACVCSTEKLPVEAKLPWYKQAQELEEGAVVSEEPS